MKIGITGTTSGIGRELRRRFQDVLCFDRTDGDIQNYNEVYDKLKECDCFINNAYNGKAQITLLELFFKKWKDKSKKIVNIGSATCSYPPSGMPDQDYVANKIELKKTHRKIVSESTSCKSYLINFALVETKMTATIHKPKMSVNHAVDNILHVLESPFYIPEIYIYAK